MQLQAIVNCSCLCSLHFVMLITNAKPCQNSVLNLLGMESSLMPLPDSWISAKYLFKIKFKAFKTLLNSVEYIISGKRVFLFPCLKILLGHRNRLTQCNHHEPSCGVSSSCEGRETPPFSPLPLSPLWFSSSTVQDIEMVPHFSKGCRTGSLTSVHEIERSPSSEPDFTVTCDYST
jgi:hypothetical protein